MGLKIAVLLLSSEKQSTSKLKRSPRVFYSMKKSLGLILTLKIVYKRENCKKPQPEVH